MRRLTHIWAPRPRAQNTFWWIDRSRGVCAVFWSNVLPFGSQRVYDLWETCEVELYKGLS